MNSNLNLFLAFIAGVVSFLSPCVLPLIPGYISLISGASFKELTADPDRRAVVKKAVTQSVFFILGFSAVFTILGAFASGLGSPLGDKMPLLKKIAGVLVILFGLHTMGVLPIKWLYYEKRLNVVRLAPGALGTFLIGGAFAFGWTPCVGPVLASVLALATSEESVARGMLMLFVYSLGIGVPFLLTAFGVGSFLKFFQTYKRFIRWGEIFAGALLVGIGVLIFTNQFRVLSGFFSFFNRFTL